MKKIFVLILLVVLVVGCKLPEKQITTQEPIYKQPPVIEQETIKHGLALKDICQTLITAEEFEKLCKTAAITASEKISTDTCWISFKDQANTRLTAGFTTVDWKEPAEANREFERGLDIRKLEASADVGERNYEYAEIERENFIWVRGKYVTRIGASTEICSKENLLNVAKAIDAKLV